MYLIKSDSCYSDYGGYNTMKKIRAIFIGDVRFDECPVFELNIESNYFEMIIDKEIRYKKEVVIKDDDFIIFNVEDDIATVIKKQEIE